MSVGLTIAARFIFNHLSSRFMALLNVVLKDSKLSLYHVFTNCLIIYSPTNTKIERCVDPIIFCHCLVLVLILQALK